MANDTSNCMLTRSSMLIVRSKFLVCWGAFRCQSMLLLLIICGFRKYVSRHCYIWIYICFCVSYICFCVFYVCLKCVYIVFLVVDMFLLFGIRVYTCFCVTCFLCVVRSCFSEFIHVSYFLNYVFCCFSFDFLYVSLRCIHCRLYKFCFGRKSTLRAKEGRDYDRYKVASTISHKHRGR